MMTNMEEISRWASGQITATLPEEAILASFHAQHPRTVFLKCLPSASSIVDVGAGEGSLNIFRVWPSPAREDVKIFAYAMEKGVRFDDYDGFELGNWDVAPPDFGGQTFDAIFCSHFIEHILRPDEFVHWAGSKLKPGGRLYLEWPSELAMECPTRGDLQAAGCNVIIGNYFDDLTHKALPSRELLIDLLQDQNIRAESQGVVRMPLFESDLLAYYQSTGDQVALQYAYWLKTGWCQYVVAQKG